MPGFIGTHTSTTRYNWGHQKARAIAFRQLPEWSPCVRCHRMMYKWSKDKQGRSALHYDHHDSNTRYLGFSHRTCNMRAGASKGGRIAKARRRARTQHHAMWGVQAIPPTPPTTHTTMGGSATSRW